MKALKDLLAKAGLHLEWGGLMEDLGTLGTLETVTVEQAGKRFAIRTDVKGAVGKAFQAASVALPPRIRPLPSAAGPPTERAGPPAKTAPRPQLVVARQKPTS